MDFLSEVNEKYSTLEAEVEKKLEKIQTEENKIEKKLAIETAAKKQQSKKLSYEEALKRNSKLLKSLEMTKARLRSRSAFSPVEQILEEALEKYKTDVLGGSKKTADVTAEEQNKTKKSQNFYENITSEE